MAKKEYDNTNKGALFINEEKETLAKEKDTTKWADYKGSVNIEGVEYWLSGWKKEIKNGERQGEKMLSLAVTPREDSKGSPKKASKPEGDDPF